MALMFSKYYIFACSTMQEKPGSDCRGIFKIGSIG
jgi:hypothetical protein